MHFVYNLARELKKTVSELLSSMSQTELIHWIAYFKIENEELDGNKKKTTDEQVDENGYKVVSEEEQKARDEALMSQLKKMAGIT